MGHQQTGKNEIGRPGPGRTNHSPDESRGYKQDSN